MELQEKQYEVVLYDFDKAVELAPENPDSYLSRGECYLNMKKKKQAKKDLQRALELGADRQYVMQLMRQLK